jgi:hypothetical protein
LCCSGERGPTKPFEQVRDVIDRARTIHRKMGELYDQLGDVAERPRVEMLLDYRGRHERQLEEVISTYEEHESVRNALQLKEL